LRETSRTNFLLKVKKCKLLKKEIERMFERNREDLRKSK